MPRGAGRSSAAGRYLCGRVLCAEKFEIPSRPVPFNAKTLLSLVSQQEASKYEFYGGAGTAGEGSAAWVSVLITV